MFHTVRPSAALRNVVTRSIEQQRRLLCEAFGSDAPPLEALDADSLHVSLSRACFVDIQYVDSLCAQLHALAQRFDARHCTQQFVALKYLVNDDKSRSYLALLLDRFTLAGRDLLSLVERVDERFEALDLPLYHDNPMPHMSIASVACDVEALLDATKTTTTSTATSTNIDDALLECVKDELTLSRCVPCELLALVVHSGQRIERFTLVRVPHLFAYDSFF